MKSRRVESILVDCDPVELRRGLKTLLENIPGAAYRCLMDEHWSMIWLSDSIQELTGYAAEEFTDEGGGVTFEELIVEEDRARVRSFITAAVERGEPFQIAYRVTTASGERRWLWEQGQRVDSEGGGVLEGFIADITRVRALEERNARAHRLETLGLMAGGLLHDMGNLMTPIQGCLELLLMEDLAEPLRETVTDALHASGRVMNLVGQIRHFVKDQPAAEGVCQPDEVIGRFRSLLERLLTSAHTLHLDLGAGGARVAMPEGDLELILLNLVVNAVEANPEGCAVTISTRVEVDEELRVLRLDVVDDGRGIAPEHMEQLFEPLYTTKESGSGLGLANARRLIQSARGRVSASSTPGVETRFRVVLPTLQVSERLPVVLLVEPNHLLRQLAARQLGARPTRVLAVLGEGQAMDLLEETEEPISALVLGGLATPRRDALIEQVKARSPGVTVILLSELLEE